MSYEWFDFFDPRGILDFKEKKTLRKKQNEFFFWICSSLLVLLRLNIYTCGSIRRQDFV